jgi:hypothetical protein
MEKTVSNSTNEAVVRDFYADWNPGHLADDVEWRLAEGFPSGGHYRGREAVLEQWWPRHAALFPEWQAQPRHFLDAGQAVVVLGTYAGRAAASEQCFEIPFAHLWWLKDGRIAAFDQHTDTLALDRASRAAGAA